MATSLQKQLDSTKTRVSKLINEVRDLKKERASMHREVRLAVAGERQAKKALVRAQITISRLEAQLQNNGITPVTK